VAAVAADQTVEEPEEPAEYCMLQHIHYQDRQYLILSVVQDHKLGVTPKETMVETHLLIATLQQVAVAEEDTAEITQLNQADLAEELDTQWAVAAQDLQISHPQDNLQGMEIPVDLAETLQQAAEEPDKEL
jgi:hypothetical protein